MVTIKFMQFEYEGVPFDYSNVLEKEVTLVDGGFDRHRLNRRIKSFEKAILPSFEKKLRNLKALLHKNYYELNKTTDENEQKELMKSIIEYQNLANNLLIKLNDKIKPLYDLIINQQDGVAYYELTTLIHNFIWRIDHRPVYVFIEDFYLKGGEISNDC